MQASLSTLKSCYWNIRGEEPVPLLALYGQLLDVLEASDGLFVSIPFIRWNIATS